MKNLALASFLFGALIAIGSGVYYLTTSNSLSEERREQEKILAEGKGALELLETMLNVASGRGISGTLPLSDAGIDLNSTSEILKKTSEVGLAMTKAREEIERLDQRLKSATRVSIFGAAVGIFLSVILAPFLLIATKAN